MILPASALVALFLVVIDISSPLRALVTFWFLFFCPGMAVVQLLAIRDRLGQIMLAIVLSVALATLTAMAMIYADVWSPELAVTLLAAFTLAATFLPRLAPSPLIEGASHGEGQPAIQFDRMAARARLRLLLGAQSALGAVGLTSAARRMLWWLNGRGPRQRAIRTMLPAVRAAIPEQQHQPPPSEWTAVHALPTIADRMVFLIGPRLRPPVAIVKLASKDGAPSNLERETAFILELRADRRLGDWERYLPSVLAAGEADGMAYRVEQLVPGGPATELLSRADARERLPGAMARVISELHQRTATPVRIDSTRLRPWVDDPIDTLLELTESRPGWKHYRPRLERSRTSLRKELLNRTVALSWIHGDYWPANVLVANDTETVNGIIDWDLAEAEGLPLLDVMHLILSLRMIDRQQEMGVVVSSLLREHDWTREERALLASAWSSLPGTRFGRRELLLLAWLRHVDKTRTKAQRFGGPLLWESQNVERVLEVL